MEPILVHEYSTAVVDENARGCFADFIRASGDDLLQVEALGVANRHSAFPPRRLSARCRHALEEKRR